MDAGPLIPCAGHKQPVPSFQPGMPPRIKKLARLPTAPSPHRRTLRRFEGHNHARELTFTCFRGQPFLRSDRACRWLIDALAAARAKHGFDLWAYCIMPTHTHLLLYYPAASGLRMGAILTSVKRPVTLRAVAWARRNRPSFLERMRDRQPNGKTHLRFWQRGGGYDRNLHTPEAVRDAVRYIHRNPVEAGLCVREIDWPWSSAKAWAGEPTPLALDLDRFPR